MPTPPAAIMPLRYNPAFEIEEEDEADKPVRIASDCVVH